MSFFNQFSFITGVAVGFPMSPQKYAYSNAPHQTPMRSGGPIQLGTSVRTCEYRGRLLERPHPAMSGDNTPLKSGGPLQLGTSVPVGRVGSKKLITFC